MKFACISALKACVNNRAVSGRHAGDYEMMSYGEPCSFRSNANNDAGVDNWRHSTQVDTDGHAMPRRPAVPDFDVYARTRTLIRQQTESLIRHGYYDDGDHEGQESTELYATQSTHSECSCSGGGGALTSTQIPSSLVTSTFDHTRSSSSFSSSSAEFYTLDNMSSSSSSSSSNDSDSTVEILVCTYEFKSSIEGDLCLRLGERVMLVHAAKSSEYWLVKSLDKQKCGYVPRFCLTPLNQLNSKR